VFYIFDIPRNGKTPLPDRSNRCMNCHAGADTGYVPGLVIKSVVPGPSGGSLTAFRIEQTGHGIPLDQRFGGYYLTGSPGFTNSWANLTGRLTPDGLIKRPIEPGTLFNIDRYAARTSNLLPQLLHEHQAGFVNRVVEAIYRVRTSLYVSNGSLTPSQKEELDQQARKIVRYVLFADEVSLPTGGIAGDNEYREEFLRNRRTTKEGISLKDFELKTRLFKYRCSYMVYSPLFEGMPGPLKERVEHFLKQALDSTNPNPDYQYLPQEEKSAIRSILKTTLKGFTF
jgi:hypothetical protein